LRLILLLFVDGGSGDIYTNARRRRRRLNLEQRRESVDEATSTKRGSRLRLSARGALPEPEGDGRGRGTGRDSAACRAQWGRWGKCGDRVGDLSLVIFYKQVRQKSADTDIK